MFPICDLRGLLGSGKKHNLAIFATYQCAKEFLQTKLPNPKKYHFIKLELWAVRQMLLLQENI